MTSVKIHISGMARSLIVFILSVSLIALCAFSLITTKSWINRPFPGFLVMGNNYGAVIWLPDWEGFKQGIRFKDIVTAVNGQPISSGDELNRIAASTEPGTPLTYTIIKGEREQNLTIPVTVFSANDYFFIFYFNMLIGLVFCGTGLVVFAVRPNLSASRAFLFFSVIFGIYLISAPEFFTNHVNSLPLTALPLLGPSILIMALYFPEKIKWSRHFMAFILLTAVPLVVLNHYFYQDVLTFSFINGFHVANIFISALLGLFLLILTFRSSDELVRRKIKIVFYGSFIAFLGVVGVVFGTIVLSKISFFWSLPFVAVLPLSFAYAITMGELFDVELFTGIRHSLAFRLFTFLLLIGILVFVPTIIFLVRENQKSLQHQILESAKQTNELIINTTRYSMLKNDRQAIDSSVRMLKRMPEIEQLRIFSKKQISFSTDREEIGKQVEEEAPQCAVCHRVDPVLEAVPEEEELQIFTSPDKSRYLVKIDPILNSPSCSMTRCHPSVDEQKVLGLLETRLSLDEVDEKIALARSQMILLLVVCLLSIQVLAGAFIWLFVHRRIKKLAAGTIKVGEGDLDHRVEERGVDELSKFSRSFNEMIEKVKKMVELEISYRELKQVDELKDNLLHMVSHDLRTPMTGILGYAYLLEEGMEDIDQETQKNYLGIMISEGERLTRLINNLLDLQRFEAGRMELEFVKLDLIKVVRESLDVFKGALEKQEVSLVSSFPARPVMVQGHFDRLKQVITNLLSNAIKFTGEGGTVTVKTDIISDDGRPDRVKVSVTDTGRGIPLDLQPGIFDKFQQATKDKRSKGEGSGLGLALVKEIIDYHKGSIGFESEPGKGSTFYFILTTSPQGEKDEKGFDS